MITVSEGVDPNLRSLLQEARKRLIIEDAFTKEQSYQAIIQLDFRMLEDPYYLEHCVRMLVDNERRMVYSAVVNSSAEWTAIRSRFLARNSVNLMLNMDAAVRVDVYSADERIKVYVPIETSRMPRDVFKCNFCGGYTKNDRRGNCAACGAPRSEDPQAWGYGR